MPTQRPTNSVEISACGKYKTLCDLLRRLNCMRTLSTPSYRFATEESPADKKQPWMGQTAELHIAFAWNTDI